jgi:hypothetical protein
MQSRTGRSRNPAHRGVVRDEVRVGSLRHTYRIRGTDPVQRSEGFLTVGAANSDRGEGPSARAYSHDRCDAQYRSGSVSSDRPSSRPNTMEPIGS